LIKKIFLTKKIKSSIKNSIGDTLETCKTTQEVSPILQGGWSPKRAVLENPQHFLRAQAARGPNLKFLAGNTHRRVVFIDVALNISDIIEVRSL
jgi:hypothetical protein